MTLEQDIKLSSEAFKTAANEMSALKTRAETLKTTLEQMYNDLTTALDTPAGKDRDRGKGRTYQTDRRPYPCN